MDGSLTVRAAIISILVTIYLMTPIGEHLLDRLF